MKPNCAGEDFVCVPFLGDCSVGEFLQRLTALTNGVVVRLDVLIGGSWESLGEEVKVQLFLSSSMFAAFSEEQKPSKRVFLSVVQRQIYLCICMLLSDLYRSMSAMRIRKRKAAVGELHSNVPARSTFTSKCSCSGAPDLSDRIRMRAYFRTSPLLSIVKSCCFPLKPRRLLSESPKTRVFECEDFLCGNTYTLKMANVHGALSMEVAALIRLQGIEGVPQLERHGQLYGCEALLFRGVGRTIWNVLEDLQALSPKKVLKGFDYAGLHIMACQLVATLSDVHARGLVHRDISSENIVLIGTRWQLIDFGSAGPPGESSATVPVTERFLSDRAVTFREAVLSEDDDFEALVHVLSFLTDVLGNSLHNVWNRNEDSNVRAMVVEARKHDKKRQ